MSASNKQRAKDKEAFASMPKVPNGEFYLEVTKCEICGDDRYRGNCGLIIGSGTPVGKVIKTCAACCE